MGSRLGFPDFGKLPCSVGPNSTKYESIEPQGESVVVEGFVHFVSNSSEVGGARTWRFTVLVGLGIAASRLRLKDKSYQGRVRCQKSD